MNYSDAKCQILKRIDELLSQKPFSFVAIDGRCGSGKTTLAKQLAERYDANLFHMDDFYLPFEMQTTQRLELGGGHMDHERFFLEVIDPLLAQKPFSFRAFDCHRQEYKAPIHITLKKINIVEGSYAMHPNLINVYDLKIFMTVNTHKQFQRIKERSGDIKAERFKNLWIPMEERYFKEFNIEKQSDFVIDTSELW
ncbi:MAG: (d)CMP kinase [Eubacteriales bacterium]|nr:(d)CMP kinase [Eubacteriales bacterium]